MYKFEIWTDGEGNVLDAVESAIEQTIVAGVANGDLHPDDADTMRAELRGYAAAREQDTPASISDDASSATWLNVFNVLLMLSFDNGRTRRFGCSRARKASEESPGTPLRGTRA